MAPVVTSEFNVTTLALGSAPVECSDNDDEVSFSLLVADVVEVVSYCTPPETVSCDIPIAIVAALALVLDGSVTLLAEVSGWSDDSVVDSAGVSLLTVTDVLDVSDVSDD